MIVWMDGIVFKVRDNGKIINKTVYLCVGLKQNGLKEVLGMWGGKTESSSFWILLRDTVYFTDPKYSDPFFSYI